MEILDRGHTLEACWAGQFKCERCACRFVAHVEDIARKTCTIRLGTFDRYDGKEDYGTKDRACVRCPICRKLTMIENYPFDVTNLEFIEDKR